jgi:hypothetical protein
MSSSTDPPSSPPHRSLPSQRSTPNRSSSYFTYPVSYAVNGILRRLNTDMSPPSEAQSRSEGNSNRNSIGNIQSQLQSTAASLSHSFTSLVSSTTSDMNSVFQPPHRIASPFQPPPLTPLDLKGWRGGMREKGKLLSKSLAEEIRLLLPPRLQLVDEWSLAYSLEQNGVSLGTLYKKSDDYRGKRGGFVLVIKDGGGSVRLPSPQTIIRITLILSDFRRIPLRRSPPLVFLLRQRRMLPLARAHPLRPSRFADEPPTPALRRHHARDPHDDNILTY